MSVSHCTEARSTRCLIDYHTCLLPGEWHIMPLHTIGNHILDLFMGNNEIIEAFEVGGNWNCFRPLLFYVYYTSLKSFSRPNFLLLGFQELKAPME